MCSVFIIITLPSWILNCWFILCLVLVTCVSCNCIAFSIKEARSYWSADKRTVFVKNNFTRPIERMFFFIVQITFLLVNRRSWFWGSFFKMRSSLESFYTVCFYSDIFPQLLAIYSRHLLFSTKKVTQIVFHLLTFFVFFVRRSLSCLATYLECICFSILRTQVNAD